MDFKDAVWRCDLCDESRQHLADDTPYNGFIDVEQRGVAVLEIPGQIDIELNLYSYSDDGRINATYFICEYDKELAEQYGERDAWKEDDDADNIMSWVSSEHDRSIHLGYPNVDFAAADWEQQLKKDMGMVLYEVILEKHMISADELIGDEYYESVIDFNRNGKPSAYINYEMSGKLAGKAFDLLPNDEKVLESVYVKTEARAEEIRNNSNITENNLSGQLSSWNIAKYETHFDDKVEKIQSKYSKNGDAWDFVAMQMYDRYRNNELYTEDDYEMVSDPKELDLPQPSFADDEVKTQKWHFHR